MKTLSIIVPCYNEEDALHTSSDLLRKKMYELINKQIISNYSFILFVDDGSTDSTWEIITKLNKSDNIFSGIKLSCNNGHQNAIMAGIEFVVDKCNACITIDADLQDDINIIDKMVEKYSNGFEIVYGVRKSRKRDNPIKKISALFFYKIMRLLGTQIIYNHADFRLMSEKAINALLKYQEKNLFLRGIIPSMGFNSTKLYYERSKRIAGKSKFSVPKMINLALFGITSFSVKPLRIIFVIGVICFFISCLSFIYVAWSFLSGGSVKGWTSIIGSIWFLGSIIIMSIGIIGEYVGKIYNEVKQRPLYNIEDVIYEKNK